MELLLIIANLNDGEEALVMSVLICRLLIEFAAYQAIYVKFLLPPMESSHI